MALQDMKKAGATKERINMGAIERRKAEEAQARCVSISSSRTLVC